MTPMVFWVAVYDGRLICAGFAFYVELKSMVVIVDRIDHSASHDTVPQYQ